MNNKNIILKTLQQKNISLVLLDSYCLEWNNPNKCITIINKDSHKKINAYRLKYPLNDSAKKSNRLELKSIKKNYSTFDIIKKAITRFKDYSFRLDNNTLGIYNNALAIDKQIKMVV